MIISQPVDLFSSQPVISALSNYTYTRLPFQVLYEYTRVERNTFTPSTRTDRQFTFELPTNERAFTDPNIILRTKWRIKKANGKDLVSVDVADAAGEVVEKADNVSPINYIHYTMASVIHHPTLHVTHVFSGVMSALN